MAKRAAMFCAAILAVSTLATGVPSPHLHLMMFYDYNLTEQHDFMTAVSGDSARASDMAEAWRKYKLPGFPTLPATIFDRGHKGLFPQWAQEVDSFVATIKPLIASGAVTGVFLGDEICCGGVPLQNLTSVADRLRHSLGARVVLYTNECGVMSDWPAIPSSLDYISIDFYDEHNTDGLKEVRQNWDYYHKVIYPKLQPHQGVLFVPGVFASDPAHCAAGNVSCPLDAQAEQIVAKLDGFFEWAKNDTRVAGFNPWHFSNRSNAQLPGWWDQRLGADMMPTVVAKLRAIGQYIKAQSSPRAIGRTSGPFYVTV